MTLSRPAALAALALVLLGPTGCTALRGRADAPAPARPAAREGSRDARPKPYAEVVTDTMATDDGLFTVHLSESGLRLLAEIPDSLFGREMLVVSRVARTAEGVGYGGEQVGEQAVRWERVGNFVQLRTVRYASVAADSLPIYRAVRDAQFEPVVARVPVAAVRPDSGGVVVDLTDLFTGDTPVFGLPPEVREEYKVRRLDPSRSYLSRASSYPRNVEVRSVLTYEAGAPPTGAETGTLSVEMAHSIVLLPDTPMRARRTDPRVGFFAIGQTDYGLDAQRAEVRRYATRWRLVPRDTAAYLRGELVEPVTPITYYIDPATPVQWRQALKDGVADWNVAFEAAGFRNAIRALDAPVDDPDWSPEDARYSVIRYFPSDIENAYGPHVSDPRSGEILESDIGWYHNVMNLLRNWFFVQTAATNPAARGVRFRDDVMGPLVRFVSAHEVGHTLGLPHNFGSSAAYPVDSLRSPTFTATHGTAPSIMDYARFNYVAQPGDGVTQLYPQVGEYDKWAIEWGYRWFPDTMTDDEIRAHLQAMATERAGDPAMRYGSQTGDPVDPRAQSEDLGSDGVEASRLGLANLKRIVPNLVEWTSLPNEDYATLAEIYGQVVGQWGRYLGHVSRIVGGVEGTPRLAAQAEPVYVPVSAERQRAAVGFLVDEAFTRPDWLLDTRVLSRVEAVGAADRVARLQETALGRLLEPARLGRMLEAAWLTPERAYPADEMLMAVREGLWRETETGAPIDASRRAL
ncbi:MAG TPA: zinc-dependent metalloprotease, partial [Rubricoccaceae bacterium]